MDENLMVCVTNDEEMGEPEKFIKLSVYEVENYLKASPRHAVVINHNNMEIAVWRGASEELNNFFVQALPLEEPDADGGDWTAAEAIEAVFDND